MIAPSAYNSYGNEYDGFVDSLLLDMLNNYKVSFAELLISLPGIYPSTVLNRLAHLASASEVHQQIYNRILAESKGEPDDDPRSESCEDHRIKLPIEHPLDYEWRFGNNAAKTLLDTATKLVESDRMICLLGAPSILRYALAQQYFGSITLIDKNPLVKNCFLLSPAANIFTLNVATDPLPDLEASVVIVDPPWYTEHMRVFIWAGYTLSGPSSYLLMSVPPKGTRPGIESEMEEVLCWMHQELGLKRVEVRRNILPYRSPLFERNALRAEGIVNIPVEWRRGDLWILKTEQQLRKLTTKPTLGDEAPSWNEEILLNTRIKLRNVDRSDLTFQDPSLISLIDKDVLPSVSRRDPRRDKVDVWTSGNRVFSTPSTQIVRIIVQALGAGISAHGEVGSYLNRQLDSRESALVSATVEQLKKLSLLESVEIDQYGESWTNAEPVTRVHE